ncbi:MAG: hypothetical protein MUF54_13280 [Polyangiaceae bacterium]|jgi:hypothetical protein|nr:hypothetical protein [Polyangiaceae bacterium]
MQHSNTDDRTPGDGADRPDATHRSTRYVYVARSRRAGGLSLGIDLTPSGHCSFSCVYCQASHPPASSPNFTVDVARMRDDLILRLREDTAEELRDLVLAGSGEPTSVPNLAQALDAIQNVLETLGTTIPMRIFTNGRHFGRDDVTRALAAWCDRGGEVWVKLDGACADTVAAINGRRFDVREHLDATWSFAMQHPIGIQTMLFRGPGIPPVDRVVSELVEALRQGLARGAGIREVHVLTLSRRPSDPAVANVLEVLGQDELQGLSLRICQATGLRVHAYPA